MSGSPGRARGTTAASEAAASPFHRAHLLALLPLLGLQVRSAVELGPQDGFDAHWYIGYTLAERDDSRVFRTDLEIPPLYPAYLSALMTLDPGYERYLECLHENLPHWGYEGDEFKAFGAGDLASCRRIEHPGFALQVLLAALSVVLAWLAGHVASGRPAVAHLAALTVVLLSTRLHIFLRRTPDSLVIPSSPLSNCSSPGWSSPGAAQVAGSEPRPRSSPACSSAR